MKQFIGMFQKPQQQKYHGPPVPSHGENYLQVSPLFSCSSIALSLNQKTCWFKNNTFFESVLRVFKVFCEVSVYFNVFLLSVFIKMVMEFWWLDKAMQGLVKKKVGNLKKASQWFEARFRSLCCWENGPWNSCS